MDRLSDYDYELPESLIAQTPLEDRSGSRLLWLHRDGEVEHRMFRDVIGILQPDDVLVLNNTRVSAVRLMGHKLSGGSVEALLLSAREPMVFDALLKPGKRLQLGSQINFDEGLRATVIDEIGDGVKVLRFDDIENFKVRLQRAGLVPLPPYIHERLENRDRYQTVYGIRDGSAAAPTAGLHFTDEVLNQLRERGVEIAEVTLHVGIDTFRPIQVENLNEHRMHGEICEISGAAAERINSAKGRVIAVGTTSVRTLESFAIDEGIVESGRKQSTLFIRPGFKFQIVDGMFTNFHLPRTTMLLMLSALVSREAVLRSYSQAVHDRYRFLSFGDSMLIL